MKGVYGKHEQNIKMHFNQATYVTKIHMLNHIHQWFPTFLGLRHPTKQKYNFWHLVANP